MSNLYKNNDILSMNFVKNQQRNMVQNQELNMHNQNIIGKGDGNESL